MKMTTMTLLPVTILAGAMLFSITAQTPAFADDTQAATQRTEDIVHMRDGRKLHGKIVSETRTLIVFEYRDPNLKITTKLTLKVEEIAHIERSVALAVAPDAGKPADKPAQNTPAAGQPKSADDKQPSAEFDPVKLYGSSLARKDRTDVPSFYVIPMRGQVGTDINSMPFKDIVADVKAIKPDVVVIEMECEDFRESFTTYLGQVKREEIGLLDFEEQRRVANIFQQELREFRQVLWIHNAFGMSSNLAMSFKDLYMTPTARLGGMGMVLMQSGAKGWSDSDVRAKMVAAWTGMAKGFFELGGYSLTLAEAMLDPEFLLSASWNGREVKWSLDGNGEYLVDGSKDFWTNFHAKDAEDLCVSKGTAETLDDLALLLGYREYRVADGKSEAYMEKYLETWRRAFENAKTSIEDYQKFSGWANGEDTVKYLGRAKAELEKVLAAMERFNAVEIRMQREFGTSKLDIQVLIEQINETLRQLRSSNRTGGGGGGGGGPGAGGGGRRGG